MSRIKTEDLHNFLIQKKQCFAIKATTYLKGSVKNNFLDDCIKREMNESKMAAHVIESYYTIVKQNPHLIDKEIPEIKNWIISKLRL